MNKTILLAALVASTGLLALPTFAQDATAGASARTAANIDTSSLVNGATRTTKQATDAVGSTLHKTRHHARNAMQNAEATGHAAAGTHVSTGIKANANVTGVKLDTKADADVGGTAGH